MTNTSTPAHVSSGTDRTWFITGASTGFGRLLAEEVLKAGGKVVATARKLDKIADLEKQYPKTAKALVLDVTDAGQVDSVVTQAFAQFGQVDVLVNNAGYDNTAGNMRKYFAENDGKQPGDPLRAVHAMMQVVESPTPPLRLLLGKNALQRVRAKLDTWQKEIAVWEPVTVGADFPEGE
jgi:NAD(P)-dependent dehydrogenase (short-subunit alcohol dehydrogenase family)